MAAPRSPRSRRCAARPRRTSRSSSASPISEYELIDWMHEAIDKGAGIIINPAAFTFTSMAIMDA